VLPANHLVERHDGHPNVVPRIVATEDPVISFVPRAEIKVPLSPFLSGRRANGSRVPNTVLPEVETQQQVVEPLRLQRQHTSAGPDGPRGE